MQRCIITTLSLFMVLSLASCYRNNDLTEEEVIEVIRKFDNAWLKKNSPGVDSVLAPPYIYFTQSGGLFPRDSVVATAASPEYSLSEMERSGIVVQLYGNTAVASTVWYGKGLYRGNTFNSKQRCSIIIVKQKGKVKILSEHCAPISGANFR